MSFAIIVFFAVFTTIDFGLISLMWLAFLLALGLRYFLSDRVDWSAPLRDLVGQELRAFERLRAVMNALPEPIFLLNRDLLIEMANPAAETFAGASLQNQHLSQILRAPAIRHAAEKALDKRQTQQVEITLAGTTPRSLRIFLSPLGEQDSARQKTSAVDDRLILVLMDLTQERRVEKMRSDFIANASHELRTPLASMLGFIETLRGHAKDDPEAREKFLKIMQKQAERMQRLVSDLMSLSAIELNENLPPTDSINLKEVVEDVRDTLKPLIEKRGAEVKLTLKADTKDLFVLGHRDQIIQIVQNLMDNAMKYSLPDPKVEIILGLGRPEKYCGDEAPQSGDTAARIAVAAELTVGDLIYLQVCDNGPGIKREDLPRLTERFYRTDPEQSRQRGGTGLGLAIVKHIMNRHRGGFQISSLPGCGSSFTCLFLPKSAKDGIKPI